MCYLAKRTKDLPALFIQKISLSSRNLVDQSMVPGSFRIKTKVLLYSKKWSQTYIKYSCVITENEIRKRFVCLKTIYSIC